MSKEHVNLHDFPGIGHASSLLTKNHVNLQDFRGKDIAGGMSKEP